jgi:hypothetical protein
MEIPSECDAASANSSESSALRRAIAKRVFVWALFSVLFGLTPLVALAIKSVFSPQGFRLENVLDTGDLFIVSVVLAGGAIGELFTSPSTKESQVLSIVAGFSCSFSVLANTIAFMALSKDTPTGTIVNVSLTFFLATLIASGACVGRAAA